MPADPLTAELPDEFGPKVPDRGLPMSPIQELLLDLEHELQSAQASADWIAHMYDDNSFQFVMAHINSALDEVHYLQAEEIPHP